jgi:hypothetical protein
MKNKGWIMPARFMDEGFDPETIKALAAALDAARKTLDLADTTDAVTDILVRTITDHARTGERDSARLCALALHAIRR